MSIEKPNSNTPDDSNERLVGHDPATIAFVKAVIGRIANAIQEKAINVSIAPGIDPIKLVEAEAEARGGVAALTQLLDEIDP